MSRTPAPAPAPAPLVRAPGFTLVEVLVALAIMAIIAALTWRGIDAMTRALSASGKSADDTLALQSGLTQWSADLDAMATWPAPQATGGTAAAPLTSSRSLSWDGSTLRVTRLDATGAGLRVVAWTRQGASGWWLRWQSAPFTTLSQWAAAWEAAALWGQEASINGLQASGTGSGSGASAVAILRATDWELYYFRNNAWTNPLSSASTSAGGNPQNIADVNAGLPGGIRLRLTLASGQGVGGSILLDWVRPTFTGFGS